MRGAKREPLKREVPNREPLKRDPPKLRWLNRDASKRAPPNAEFPKRELGSAERPIPESRAPERAKTEPPESRLRAAKFETARLGEMAEPALGPKRIVPERSPVEERPEKRPDRGELATPAAECPPKECQPVDIIEEEPRTPAVAPGRAPNPRLLPAAAPKPRADELAKPDGLAKPCQRPSAIPGRLLLCPDQGWKLEPMREPKLRPFIPLEPKRPAP